MKLKTTRAKTKSAQTKSGKKSKKSKSPIRFELENKSAAIGTENSDIGKVQKYLTRFGYLNSVISPGKLDEPTSRALKSFQGVFGIEETGELNPKTSTALQMHRCGTPDLGAILSIRGGESGSFVLRGCGYNKTQFTYRFVNGTNDVSGTQERNAVRNAFKTWASVFCGVSFQELTAAPTDFVIGWFTGNHGDGSPFDGAGNVLAHGFYPPPCGGSHAGELHFDDAETWSLTGTGSTFDVETVALHEIGHLLGLDHSAVAGSVMFPSYGGVRRALTQDDINGARLLYPTLCRRGDSGSQAGFVSEIAVARHNQHQAITAVRAQNGSLKLIGWNVSANGSITRTGDSASQAGAATSIAIARNASGSHFVTACRSGAGRLLLISWNINAGGTTITRLADSGGLAGTASIIRIATAGNNRFVTACKAGNGNLLLIVWRLAANGTITRVADSGNLAGTVSDIDLVALSPTRLITAVRAGNNDLKLISWSVSNTAVTRLADSGSLAGNARLVRATVDQFGHVVTAVKAANDSLKLITWNIAGNGSITRLNDSGSLAGETDDHDVSLSGNRVVTGVRTGDGHLKVILWQTAASGSITRIGDSANLAGDASSITQSEALTGAPPILTCVKTSTNSLKLISWS
ncbi:MAG: matrixin family metalloprotease [Ferruginibacter sp.]